ncbi:MAG: DDE-type integrase/transposase/recombinase [Spirochaetales bacterium]|nr:DDE-type integrase/transposase/recombinase [Spirochaetales bacterium]
MSEVQRVKNRKPDAAYILSATAGMTRRQIEAWCREYGGISWRTVYNLRKREPNLAGRPSCMRADWLELFKSFYLIEGGASVTSCWRMTIGELARRGELSDDMLAHFPCARSFKNALDRELSGEAQYFARKGRDAWYKLYSPYIERDLSAIEPGQVWFSDHHQMDLMCIDDSGSKFFAWLTVWSDWKSGKWLGWYLHKEPPCADHIFQAFYYAAIKHGLPQVAYMDNGKDYRCRDFAGGKKKYRLEVDTCEVSTLTMELGIEARFALPYNGRTKPIERDFREIKDNFNRYLIGFRGGHVKERPERLKAEIKAGMLQHIDDVAKALDFYIDEVFNELPSTGKKMKGLSRNAYWNQCRVNCRQVSAEALKLFCMRTSAARTIGRNGISDNELGVSVTYWGEWMAAYKGTKERFYLRRDPKSYQKAWVFHADSGEFAGIAEAGYWVVQGLADADVDKEKLKKAMHAKKAYEKKLREVTQTKPLEAFEVVAAASAAVSALYGKSGVQEQIKTVDVTPTKAQRAIDLAQKMGTEHFTQLGDFALPEIEETEDEIFLSETEKLMGGKTR